MLYKERYRCQYHFSPKTGWLNDPNGLIYFQGEYHMFYQYYPYGHVWGPMHWGHTVSKDLVHWEQFPVALHPDEHGYIFSGSAVVDWNNTTGFFDEGPGIVAIFTHALFDKAIGQDIQSQSIAYSCDNGRTWIKYEGNPVLSCSEEMDYRDPKVFWHDQSAQWVMVLAVGNKVHLNSSPDLKTWRFESEFGLSEGSHDGVWECPDLFELPIEHAHGSTKWVLIVSIGDNESMPEGSRTQYFVGHFDGKQFINDNSDDTVMWLDQGRDNYAGVTWSDAPNSRKIYCGWMNNWKYARATPSEGFRGVMTLPRELTLFESPEGIKVKQRPVHELQFLRTKGNYWTKHELLEQDLDIQLESDKLEIIAEFDLGSAREAGLIFRGGNQEGTIVAYDVSMQSLYIDRRLSGRTDFHDAFACQHDVKVRCEENRLLLHLYLDRASIEIFVNDGEVALTDQLFPTAPYNLVSFFAKGGSAQLITLSIHELDSIWPNTQLLDDKSQISLWSFDEGKGKFAKDLASGIDDPIHFALEKGRFQPPIDPQWRAGVSGKALLFDGYSTYIRRPFSHIRQPEHCLTVTAWLAPRSFNGGEEDRLSAIVNQHNREANQGYILGVHRHGAWSLQLGLGDEWVEIWSEEKVISNHQWSFVAATYDGYKGILKLFLNGEGVAVRQLNRQAPIASSSSDLLIGRNNQAVVLAGTFHLNMFDGLMDDVAIYDRALTDEEIRDRFDRIILLHDGSIPAIAAKDLDIPRTLWNRDRHRPQYHLSPPGHWMNEPHAPVYMNGLYHLFYQFNPKGPFWHQIHWGHCVSDDLVHWRDLPPALSPERGDLDPDGNWSGSASYDEQGLPVLFYTAANNSHSPNQSVALAKCIYDLDHDNDLRNWQKHPIPIVVQKQGQGLFGEFRDPFVWKDGNKWFMLVGSGVTKGGGTALIYSSENMTDWNYHGPFYITNYEKHPYLGVAWELPVLLPLRSINGGETSKYIFLISPWGEGADVEVFYWIGLFDKVNCRFIPDQEEPQLIDLGDFHFTGPSGMVDPQTGRSILFTIAQGERTPEIDYDSGWAHNGGFPLSLFLRDDGRLGIEPIAEVKRLRGAKLLEIADQSWQEVNKQLEAIHGDMLEIIVEFEAAGCSQYGLILRHSPNREEETLLYYDHLQERLSVDRERSTLDVRERSSGIQGGNLVLNGESLLLHIFIDRSLIETYANSLKSLTTRVYPSRPDANGLQICSDGGLKVNRMEIWEMTTA